MSSILVIDEPARVRIAQLKAFAAATPMAIEEMRARIKEDCPPGDDPRYRMRLFFGYRLVYTREFQPKLDLCHHLSVSVEGGGLPAYAALAQICELFDMPAPLHCAQWVEECADCEGAVNLVAPVSPPPTSTPGQS